MLCSEHIPKVQSVEATVHHVVWYGLLNPLAGWHYYAKACFIKGQRVRSNNIAFSCLITRLCPINSWLFKGGKQTLAYSCLPE